MLALRKPLSKDVARLVAEMVFATRGEAIWGEQLGPS